MVYTPCSLSRNLKLNILSRSIVPCRQYPFEICWDWSSFAIVRLPLTPPGANEPPRYIISPLERSIFIDKCGRIPSCRSRQSYLRRFPNEASIFSGLFSYRVIYQAALLNVHATLMSDLPFLQIPH